MFAKHSARQMTRQGKKEGMVGRAGVIYLTIKQLTNHIQKALISYQNMLDLFKCMQEHMGQTCGKTRKLVKEFLDDMSDSSDEYVPFGSKHIDRYGCHMSVRDCLIRFDWLNEGIGPNQRLIRSVTDPMNRQMNQGVQRQRARRVTV